MLILISFISVILTQVAPSYHPYSLIHPEIKLPTAKVYVNDDEMYFNFIENAQVTIRPDGTIYRLVIQFDEMKSGYMSIRDWLVPPDAMLFIFNDKKLKAENYIRDSIEMIISGLSKK